LYPGGSVKITIKGIFMVPSRKRKIAVFLWPDMEMKRYCVESNYRKLRKGFVSFLNQ
jgi:hypothetical protein